MDVDKEEEEEEQKKKREGEEDDNQSVAYQGQKLVRMVGSGESRL